MPYSKYVVFANINPSAVALTVACRHEATKWLENYSLERVNILYLNLIMT